MTVYSHSDQLDRIFGDMENIADRREWLGRMGGFLFVLLSVAALLVATAAVDYFKIGGSLLPATFLLLAVLILLLLPPLYLINYKLHQNTDDQREVLGREIERKKINLTGQIDKLK